MLNSAKVLFTGEKVVREINHRINKTFIDQLAGEDLSLEERQELANSAKKLADDNVKTEEENSEFWYKYGKNEGEIKGMLKAAAVVLAGYTIGAFLRKK